ncbi:2-dehydro-3-deoxy-6-phosphogalactonate aldolase [Polycladidibacter hongkongensis]|uniref:2-dehydro-3-deoxy-6-phosphogalactonate aldolase n=1 Tax=Polycladidibacter hongkongensis TaxID=1647556 RepID=UPI00082B1D43|nr:2-dehydro-3-deoxy-6-phosphogalactonate aldolase [Pseudovibrio hongkongensis]
MKREIIAILRGVQPHEALEVGAALVEEGINQIEVPLNSPQPLNSIARLAEVFGDKIMIGAGTVLTRQNVEDVRSAGGSFVVSPDCNAEVITETKNVGMRSIPGVLTPTECLTALRYGADGLKFFPASIIGPSGFAAVSAVLPKGTKTYAVGGVGPANFADWFAVGVTGFGMGTGIYKPGMSADDVRRRAKAIVQAYNKNNL